MDLYFAPLEGITTYIFRNTFDEFFGGANKYFAPFISSSQNRKQSPKEFNDILPENNTVKKLIPQILSNNSEDFLWTMNAISKFGYDEINLNLGCPSKTVTAKGKGSGFLKDKNKLDEFLYCVFEKANVKISIKTRTGCFLQDEFFEILDIYNKYPISEIIIHPRVMNDYYSNNPNMQIFEYAINNSKNHVCYNGDIKNCDDILELSEKYPKISGLMIGRGALDRFNIFNNSDKAEKLFEFYCSLLEKYINAYKSEKNAMFKLKDLCSFNNKLQENQKIYKKIKKANDKNIFLENLKIGLS